MNKKKNTIITFIVIGIILIGAIVFYLLNHGVVERGLSVIEKKWISDHVNQVVDISVYNDVPVYGYNGNGVNFSFLDYFTDKYKVQFNKISYYTSMNIDKIDFGFLVLNSDTDIGSNDILLYTDHYVILGSEEKTNLVSVKDIDKIGILTSDSHILKKYFNDKVEVVEYKDYEALATGITNNEISYICSPMMQYMDQILSNHLSVVGHVNDLKNRFVLRVMDNTVYQIMNKTYEEYYEKNFNKDYSQNYLNIYFNATNADDVSRKSYNSKVYHYGYVVNMPFENTIKNEFVGTISNYINDFEKVSLSEIKPVYYNSIDDLKAGMVSGDVDFALTNFDYSNINLQYVVSNSISDINYFVLSKKDYYINSIKGLKKHKVSVVSGSVFDALCPKNGVEVEKYSNTNELLRSLDDESIVLLDQETYQYYKDNKLKNYSIILSDTISNGYRFIMSKNNNAFNNLFSFYVSTIPYSNVRYMYHTDILIDKDYTILKVVLFIVALIMFLIATIMFMNRKNVTNNVTNKDDKLKFIDPMTSLKNRSYLNKNIYSWDDNVIFPQAVIVFDLDHIKRVNDKFGREAGDEIIKKVASILINQQLENTDIIRSDGDEFIIYMVGYEERDVKEYMKKLLKMMKDIPKSLGVEAGYSMIFDEVKTVDDAINEAIQMMMKSKDIEEKK